MLGLFKPQVNLFSDFGLACGNLGADLGDLQFGNYRDKIHMQPCLAREANTFSRPDNT